MGLEFLQKLDAVHLGHVDVQKDDVWPRWGHAQQSQRLDTVFGCLDVGDTQVLEVHAHDVQVDGFVIQQQDSGLGV